MRDEGKNSLRQSDLLNTDPSTTYTNPTNPQEPHRLSEDQQGGGNFIYSTLHFVEIADVVINHFDSLYIENEEVITYNQRPS